MYKEIKGDLLHAFKHGEVDVIAHQCNCYCNFGAGIARAIKHTFPAAFEADRNTTRGCDKKLGTFTYAKVQYGLIYNIYGQFHWSRRNGQATEYVYLEYGLECMRNDLIAKGLKRARIGFPLIGCGLAGGDWNTVRNIIKGVFHDFDITIYKL